MEHIQFCGSETTEESKTITYTRMTNKIIKPAVIASAAKKN